MKKLSIKLLLPIIILIVAIPFAGIAYYNNQLKPVSTSEETIRFVITPGQPFVQIANNLEKQKLIKSAFAFRLLVAQMGITNKIQAGDYKLSPNLSAREIAQELTQGALDIWITFPEGQRIEQQAQILRDELSDDNPNYAFDEKEYLELAEEGYMFPDTYLISKEASTSAVVEKLRSTFDEKVSKSLLGRGRQNNLTERQVVILASLIEREAKTNEERPIIAGILINRLKEGMPLQVDATVQYAKGYNAGNKTWWPQITVEEYQSVRSPYNTYLNPGLPPGPISNPGIESLKAASEPEDTPYFYYLHDSNGKIHYAKTVDEHNQNIQDYL